MPAYNYKCTNCGKKYLEFRDVSHPQSFTNCDVCGANYVEVTE